MLYDETNPEMFLPTHLLRGATVIYGNFHCAIQYFYSRTSCEVRQIMDEIGKEMNCISTHAPLARCDLFPPAVRAGSLHFYSRTSCEVRLNISPIFISFLHFYSRTSCEVRHRQLWPVNQPGNFYSRTSCEVRHVILSRIGC